MSSGVLQKPLDGSERLGHRDRDMMRGNSEAKRNQTRIESQRITSRQLITTPILPEFRGFGPADRKALERYISSKSNHPFEIDFDADGDDPGSEDEYQKAVESCIAATKSTGSSGAEYYADDSSSQSGEDCDIEDFKPIGIPSVKNPWKIEVPEGQIGCPIRRKGEESFISTGSEESLDLSRKRRRLSHTLRAPKATVSNSEETIYPSADSSIHWESAQGTMNYFNHFAQLRYYHRAANVFELHCTEDGAWKFRDSFEPVDWTNDRDEEVPRDTIPGKVEEDEGDEMEAVDQMESDEETVRRIETTPSRARERSGSPISGSPIEVTESLAFKSSGWTRLKLSGSGMVWTGNTDGGEDAANSDKKAQGDKSANSENKATGKKPDSPKRGSVTEIAAILSRNDPGDGGLFENAVTEAIAALDVEGLVAESLSSSYTFSDHDQVKADLGFELQKFKLEQHKPDPDCWCSWCDACFNDYAEQGEHEPSERCPCDNCQYCFYLEREPEDFDMLADTDNAGLLRIPPSPQFEPNPLESIFDTMRRYLCGSPEP